MRKTALIILCVAVITVLLSVSTSAAEFQVTYYKEEIYAGGILDMYAFTGGKGKEPITYKWQIDYGLGDGHWEDIQENEVYRGTKTDHLQFYSRMGSFDGWDAIPFQCVVTDAEGTVRYTPVIHMEIRPTSDLIPTLQRWGYGLFEPTVTNVSGLRTYDDVNYTAYAYSGDNLSFIAGSKAITDYDILTNSEVTLTREIWITENGHTTKAGDRATYTPYTVGTNAVTVEMKLRLAIGENDLGDYDTKTIRISTAKPTPVGTATVKSDCSLLRYTYNESQRLASVSKGTGVELLSKEGSYYKVYYNGFVGYIGTGLLNVQQSSYDPVIKDFELSVTAPVSGETPDFNCRVLTEGCGLYKTDPVNWINVETGEFMSRNDRFEENKAYKLVVWLEASSGYKFKIDASANPQLGAMINGNLPPFINRAYEQDPEQVIEVSYTFYAQKAPEHVCAPVLVSKVEPKCTESGHEEYYHCGCGVNYKDALGLNPVDINSWGIIPPIGHQEGNWSGNGTHHYKKCTVCNQVIAGTNAPHAGGSATCTQKAQCAVCKAAYGQAAGHRWSTDWIYKDEKGHAYQCTVCKAYDTVHPHIPGAEATDRDAQTCKECGYVIQPAKGHIHRLTKVEAREPTCTSVGNLSYYLCSDCGKSYSDKDGKILLTESILLPMVDHQSKIEWENDDMQHWKVCDRCEQQITETIHFHVANGNVCGVCGYAFGATEETEKVGDQTSKPTAESEQTEKTDESELTPHKADGTPAWSIGVMIGFICFGAAIVITVLVTKRKGGKSL